MNDMWDELFEPPDPEDVLGDLYELAVAVFDLWRNGSEPAWVAWAWGVLTSAGLTAARTEYERGELVLRLAALRAFHREFCARAFGIGEPGEPDLDPDRVLGDHPRLHPVLLGVIAERRGLDLADGTGAGEIDFDVAVTTTALDRLVATEYRRVVPALLAGAGAAEVAAATWASSLDGVRYPLPGHEIRALTTTDVTPQARAAFDWVRSGARPG